MKPKRVIDKEDEYYQKYSANVGRGLYPEAVRATEEYEAAREKVAKFIGTKYSGEVVFTHGATEGLNLIAFGWGYTNLKKGDEIILSEVEHHANLLPWLKLAESKGLKIKYIPINTKTFELEWERLKEMVGPKTKVLAITHISNVTGLVNPIAKISTIAKAINPEVLIVVDGAQAVGHMKIEVDKMGADFYVFSGHKMYGPTGIGVAWGKATRWLQTEPLTYGGGAVADVEAETFELREAPARFEAGTPAIGQAIALGEAIDLIGEIGLETITKIEEEVADYGYEKLSQIKGLRILGNGNSKIIAFTIEGIHPHDLAQWLGDKKIAVRPGHHCVIPLHKKLDILASTRMSFGIYSQKEDIDRAVEVISYWQKFINEDLKIAREVHNG